MMEDLWVEHELERYERRVEARMGGRGIRYEAVCFEGSDIRKDTHLFIHIDLSFVQLSIKRSGTPKESSTRSIFSKICKQ